MALAFADIAFMPRWRDQQGALGSARETAFIQTRDGFYQATLSETGRPYVQFRGVLRSSRRCWMRMPLPMPIFAATASM